MRNRQSGGVAAQELDDLDPFADRCSEMLGAHDLIAQIQVVRPHANFHQTLHEVAHGVGAVVHAAEQHGLIVYRNSGA